MICNSHVKTKLAAAILLAMGSATAQAEFIELGSGDNNFTMLAPNGGRVGGTNAVDVTWDGTLNTAVDTALVNMTIASETPFFGTKWFAHDVMVFGPGSYTFEACPGVIDPVTKLAEDGSRCNGGVSAPLTMVVGEGQIGAHMLFDWNGNLNIDVVNVWNVNAPWGFGPNDGSSTNLLETQDSPCNGVGKGADLTTPECAEFFATEWLFTSTDVNGNGFAGSGMVDGPFGGFNANFNIRPQVVPIPGAVWLMASGLLGLIGFARKKKV